MRIRSVTLGTNLDYPVQVESFALVDSFQQRARSHLAEAGLEVQTVRLAAQPFPEALAGVGPPAALSYACELERLCAAHGVDYVSIGTVPAARPGVDLGYVDVLPEVIGGTEVAFASVQVADRGGGIHLAAIRRAARAIAEIARSTPSGFGNLRLAVLANCGPGSPFFPASFHRGPDTTFAIATEAADLAVEGFARAATLEEARGNLRRAVEDAARAIEEACRDLEAEFGFRFGGIDFSLAPYPEQARSIGYAVERLGVEAFGGSGTLFATALMTQVLREARFTHCGFSGVMYPVLEDATMAQRSAEGLYTLDSLLLYSAVCGTGLDTVPLPGDVGEDELAAILLDVATLALVADKPLTARLMPVPGKRAGDMTDFDFSYFANGRVLDVRRRGAAKILGASIRGNDFVRLDRRPAQP
jgi:uncharacterized protein (UPF0210 family)